jgi:hypothetical protein
LSHDTVRIVGHRVAPPIEAVASAAALKRGLAVVDAAATFGWAHSTGQRKGVYRFKTFEEMQEHRVTCLVGAMAQRAMAAKR